MACSRHDRAMAFAIAHGKSHFCPFQKWHASAFPHLGRPLSLLPPPAHHTPSIHWAALQAWVEHNYEYLHHHFAPHLPSFRDVGTMSSPTTCRIGSLCHWTSWSKQGMRVGDGVRFARQGGPYIHRWRAWSLLWGEKGKCEQIWNKPKPTNTNTKPTPISKTQITCSIVWGGDIWGMHRIDLKRLDILGFVTVW